SSTRLTPAVPLAISRPFPAPPECGPMAAAKGDVTGAWTENGLASAMAATLLVISCSLSPTSRSRLLGAYAYQRLTAIGAAAELVDLSNLNLPLCDGEGTCDTSDVGDLRDRIRAAD